MSVEACNICGGDHWIPGLFDGERVRPQQPLAWYQCLPDLFPSHFPVEKNGRWGLMEPESGLLVVPFCYEAVELPDGDLFAAKDGGWGVVDLAGRVHLPFHYDAIKLHACADGRTGWPLTAADCTCALVEGKVILLDPEFRPVWEDLTAWPERYGSYLLIRRGENFGVAAQDGRPICEVTLTEKEARNLIQILNHGMTRSKEEKPCIENP